MKDIYQFADIHSHKLESADNKIINLNADDEVPSEGYYSIGLHPWATENIDAGQVDHYINEIKQKAVADNVIAIGECGLDKLRGGKEEIQKYAFELQIEISELLHKPLIIHCVRAFDQILQLYKIRRPNQLWIVHGFRGNPELAKQLLSKGIALSYGEHFNCESLRLTPKSLMFSETDESTLTIDEIRKRMSTIC